MSLGIEIARMMSGQEERPKKPATPPAVLARNLIDAAARYSIRAFKPGDLVTPRRGFAMVGEGEPHVVLEIFQRNTLPIMFKSNSDSAPTLFADMRICCEMNGDLHCYIAEAWMYEPYTGEVEAAP